MKAEQVETIIRNMFPKHSLVQDVENQGFWFMRVDKFVIRGKGYGNVWSLSIESDDDNLPLKVSFDNESQLYHNVSAVMEGARPRLLYLSPIDNALKPLHEIERGGYDCKSDLPNWDRLTGDFSQ